MGHLISADGLKREAAKIEAIPNQKMPTPESKQDVRQIRGTINYLQKFTSNLSEVTAPL